MSEQLLLFEEPKEQKLEREIVRLKEQTEKVRKGLYAKHGELYRLYLEQKHELETLKTAICRTTQPDLSMERKVI